MKIAMPVAGEQLCTHFGHCESFQFFDADPGTKEVKKLEIMTAPPHEPGLLPKVLGDQGVSIVIAGGMGARAQELFNQRGIKVIVGANPSVGSPEEIVKAYLSGVLSTGQNPCDH
jgi:predicted Fe-Mo cluster-binding NifX family protein